MNCSLFVKNISLFLLLSCPTVFAGWELTDYARQFKFITARNNTLVGIEGKSNLPWKWEKPFWKKLSEEEFLSLATDGINIIGVRQRDKRAYALTGRSPSMIGSQTAISFDQLTLTQNQIIGRGSAPYTFTYSWNNTGPNWNAVGDLKFWSIDAAGHILCGIQTSHESKALNNLAFMWRNKKWHQLGKQQVKQIATDGTKIIGIGVNPKNFVFERTGRQWKQLGTERFNQIALDKNILCGIQEKIQLILLWNGHKWLALDTKKFTAVATDGKTIYGLANDKKVYYWTNR